MPSITVHCVLLQGSPMPPGLLAAAAGNDAVTLYIDSYVCFESIERDGETDRWEEEQKRGTE